MFSWVCHWDWIYLVVYPRSDKVSRKSSTVEKKYFENHYENTSASEDMKELPFPCGFEGHSREEHQREEMCWKITHKNAIRRMRYEKIQDENERILRFFWTGICNRLGQSGAFFAPYYLSLLELLREVIKST